MSVAPTFVDSGLTGASAFAEAENALAVAQAQVYSPEFGVASGILALTLFVRASILGWSDAIAEEAEPVWARVELFGHSVRYGEVVEVEFAGRRFVEIRTPEISGRVPLEGGGFEEKVVVAADSKRYHPNAIYAIDDRSEEEILNTIFARAGLFFWQDGFWYVEPSKTEWSSPVADDRDEHDSADDRDEDDLF